MSKKKILMKKLDLLFLIFLMIAGHQAQGCSCSWGGGFLQASRYQELIVLVKVESYITQLKSGPVSNINSQDTVAIEVEVLKIIKGRVSKNRVRVFGDNGYLCRPYIQNRLFGQGKQYLLNLIASTESEYTPGGERSGDYFLSSCSENWLPYNPQTALVYGMVDRNRFNARKKYFRLDMLLAWIDKR